MLPRIWKQGVKIEDFWNLGGRSCHPIYKNDHSNLIYWLSKTKCASLCHLMYLLSSMSETFEIFPWTQTNTENLAKYNWLSFSPKSCVWESKWLPGGWLGKSLLWSLHIGYWSVAVHDWMINIVNPWDHRQGWTKSIDYPVFHMAALISMLCKYWNCSLEHASSITLCVCYLPFYSHKFLN